MLAPWAEAQPERELVVSLNLASIVTETAARVPETAAVRLGEVDLTYAELDRQSARLAALLVERGLEPGIASA